MSASSLEKKVILVTGSSRGIGYSIADSILESGGSVILNGTNEASLIRASTTLKEKYNKLIDFLVADVSSYDQVSSMYKEIYKRYKKLDGLVNNAGILKDCLIGMTTPDQINNILSVNVNGVLYNTIFASRIMSKNTNGGSIINLSSVVGRFGNEGQLAYSTSKAAVIGATLTSSKELACNNIRVNAIAPGIIDTDMIKSIPEEKLEALQAKIRLKRLGNPKDIANLAVFLCSDLANYITGQVIGVDGGISL
jgi:3-oxoacyl-[acyl-carrier protein] reductase